jgi:diguanylate cyclase
MIHDLFLNGIIIIAFITIGNLLLRDHNLSPSSPFRIRLICGMMTGMLACFLMTNSVTVMPNVIIDFRNIAIIIAAVFGGFVSSILTSLIIGSFRMLSFGLTDSSILAFFVALVMGIGCPLYILEDKSCL